jgi:hypothetical protein
MNQVGVDSLMYFDAWSTKHQIMSTKLEKEKNKTKKL